MKKLIIALALIPMSTFSNTNDLMQDKMNKELQKEGLPIAGSGVTIVPDGEIKMPEWQRNKLKSDAKEMQDKGYIEQTSDRASELIHIQEQIKSRGYSKNLSTNEGDSGLQKNASNISFSYSYIGIPSSEIKEFYGIAPVGSFLNTNPKGWTGAVAFFNSGFSNCAYTEKNIIPGQGGVQIEESVARNDINNKTTTITIIGNDNSGYLYDVWWFDSNYYRQLECATNKYSKDYLNKTLELAKKIDVN